MIANPRFAARPLAAVRIELGGRAALAGIVAISAIARALAAFTHVTPSYFPDEYLYAAISRSLGASGRPLVRGSTAHFPALLEPLLAAPLWAAGSLETGYRLVQLENAVFMSLAAIPVYALARHLGLTTRYSLACAAFAVAGPSLTYSGSVLADPVAYPLALTALYGGLRALERPSARSQLAFLALASLACFARVQYAVLFPAFAVGALVVDQRRAFRTQRLPLGLFAAASAGVAVVGLEGAAGYYSVVASDHIGAATLRWLGVDLFLVVLSSGMAIAPGAVVGLLAARGRAQVAFAALAGPFAAASLLEAAVYASNGADDFEGRYLMALAALLPIAFGLYLQHGRPARSAAAAIAAVVAVLTALVPLSGYAAGGGYSNSPFLWSLKALEWPLGIADASLVFALAATAGALLAVAVAWRRLPSAVAIVWTLAVAAALSAGASIFSTNSSELVRARLVAPDPSWIDHARIGPVAAVETPGTARGPLTEQLFWNRSLDRELLLAGADPTDALATSKLSVARDGTLLAAERPLQTSLLFDEYMTTPVLTGAVPAGRLRTFVLLRRTATPKLRLLEVGRFWDGWLSVRGTLQTWAPRAGAIEFTLSLPWGHRQPAVLRFTGRRVVVRPGRPVQLRLPVPRGHWSSTFALVSGATVLPDQRPVIVRSTAPVFVPR